MRPLTTTRRTRFRRRRPGFSLIEMSVVMGATALAAGLLAAAFLGALRIEKASAGALQQLGVRHLLADQFRADVAMAAETPERWQEDVAGPACLILRIDDTRHVVYRWEENRLVRSHFAGGEEHQYAIALGGNSTTVEFARAGPAGRLLTLRLFTLLPSGDKNLATEISAALGGDRQ